MMIKRLFIGFAALLGVVLLSGGGYAVYFYYNQPRAEFWQSAITAFEQEDRQNPPAPGAVVFIGSSTIVFWKSLAADMAPMRVLNRGFGGANLPHLTHYADRIVFPYHPRAIVIYAGDNDFGGPQPKTAKEVFAAFRELTDLITQTAPETPVYYIAIKPSLLRWKVWPQMNTANHLIAEYAATRASLHFIDISPAMLGADGRPRKELFRFDGLHLNQSGYALWTSIIKPILLKHYAGSLST
jgi:lysophospholipase L1-like esterase